MPRIVAIQKATIKISIYTPIITQNKIPKGIFKKNRIHRIIHKYLI